MYNIQLALCWTIFSKIMTNKPQDQLFLDPGRRIGDFAFDAAVANVFDDMLRRSVPFYLEIQSMLCDLAAEFAISNSRIYDLGCSTGTSLSLLAQRLANPGIELIGIDASPAMLEKAKAHLEEQRVENYRLLQQDLNNRLQLQDASVVILNLVLQFVRPINRQQLIQNVYNGLHNNGCILLVEKITHEHPQLNDLYIKSYHQFKKRHLYTDVEIARKRKALENVLIPHQNTENVQLLKNCGFEIIDDFFRWFNFSGLIGIKTA